MPAFQDLKDLIADGIPAALQRGPSEGAGGGGGDSGAFMMGGDEEEEEASLLDGVVTAIPRVEVCMYAGALFYYSVSTNVNDIRPACEEFCVFFSVFLFLRGSWYVQDS